MPRRRGDWLQSSNKPPEPSQTRRIGTGARSLPKGSTWKWRNSNQPLNGSSAIQLATTFFDPCFAQMVAICQRSYSGGRRSEKSCQLNRRSITSDSASHLGNIDRPVWKWQNRVSNRYNPKACKNLSGRAMRPSRFCISVTSNPACQLLRSIGVFLCPCYPLRRLQCSPWPTVRSFTARQ